MPKLAAALLHSPTLESVQQTFDHWCATRGERSETPLSMRLGVTTLFGFSQAHTEGRKTNTTDALTQVLRSGAQQILQVAIEAEVQDFVQQYQDRLLDDGCAAVVSVATVFDGLLFTVSDGHSDTDYVSE